MDKTFMGGSQMAKFTKFSHCIYGITLEVEGPGDEVQLVRCSSMMLATIKEWNSH